MRWKGVSFQRGQNIGYMQARKFKVEREIEEHPAWKIPYHKESVK